MSSTYTMSDVKEADQLADQMTLTEVAKRVEPTVKTLSDWKQKELITQGFNPSTKYDKDTIKRADWLWDAMPITDVADVLGVPLSTLDSWRQRGWISTDTDWRKENTGRDKKGDPKTAAHLVYDRGMTHAEAADKMGVHQSTVTRYLQQYRTQPDHA